MARAQTWKILASLRAVLSLAWLAAAMVWQDRAAWMGGTLLVATHVTAGLVVLYTLNRHALKRHRRPLAAASDAPAPVDTDVRAHAGAHQERHACVAVLVSDAAGLVGLLVYALNLYGAYRTACPAVGDALEVTRLACAAWHEAPALVVVVLIALGATALAHVGTLVLAAVVLRRLPAAPDA